MLHYLPYCQNKTKVISCHWLVVPLQALLYTISSFIVIHAGGIIDVITGVAFNSVVDSIMHSCASGRREGNLLVTYLAVGSGLVVDRNFMVGMLDFSL